MARPAPTPQAALTIVQPLRNAGQRGRVAALLRRYDMGLPAVGMRAQLEQIAELHYLSWFLIDGESANDPPMLVMEANFDGPADAFLLRLTRSAPIRDRLDELYGYCSAYPGADASPEAAARWLESGNQPPHIFYVARPGTSAQQIEEEARIARRLQGIAARLGEPRGRRLDHVRRIWDALGGEGRERILGAPEKPFWVRYSLRERPLQALLFFAGALLGVGGLLTLVLLGLHVCEAPLWDWLVPTPGAITAAWRATCALVVLAGALLAVWALLMVLERPRDVTLRMFLRVWRVKGLEEMVKFTLWALPGAALIVGAVTLLAWVGPQIVLLGAFLLLGLLLLAGLFALRVVLIAVKEQSDPVDELRWNPADRRAVLRRENRDGQNHFVSVTEIKPGCLRRNTLRAILWWVHKLALVLYDRRGLSGIPSIHFARWQILKGGRRLLFVTNYDGGWAGYLGEFIATASAGMNAIWGNTRGFPRTFYLFADGVKDEQRFKAFARASQVETLFWYRRYPQLSLAAIRRNAELREELARLSKYLQPDAKHAPEEGLDAFLRRFSRR